MGLPVAGETLSFVRNPFRWLDRHRARYGDVFKSRVVGRNVVFLAGLEGAEAFYDPENITRSDAHPFLMVDMFGGTNFEMYDGRKHLALKTIALTAFDHSAIAGYLPDMQGLVDSTLSRLAAREEFRACTELRTLAIEAICWNVLGLPPGPETEALTQDYGAVLAALASSFPVRLPVTPYGRAMATRDRVMARLRTLVQDRRARPGADALSRMLAGTAVDGQSYTDHDAVLEAHHIVIAGFIVYVLMAEVMRRLAEQPDLQDRCLSEIESIEGPLTMEALGGLEFATNVVQEAKRIVPLVPLAFGRARRTFDCKGFEVPQDWTVYLALHLNSHDPAVYAAPDRFDPDRFGPERAEHLKHPLAFIPQGAEPPTGHRCLGLDYSTFLTLVFLTSLVRGYEWDLPDQDLRYDWKKRPPEPREGIRVRLRPR
jgi:cytochrome P450